MIFTTRTVKKIIRSTRRYSEVRQWRTLIIVLLRLPPNPHLLPRLTRTQFLQINLFILILHRSRKISTLHLCSMSRLTGCELRPLVVIPSIKIWFLPRISIFPHRQRTTIQTMITRVLIHRRPKIFWFQRHLVRKRGNQLQLIPLELRLQHRRRPHLGLPPPPVSGLRHVPRPVS